MLKFCRQSCEVIRDLHHAAEKGGTRNEIRFESLDLVTRRSKKNNNIKHSKKRQDDLWGLCGEETKKTKEWQT